MAAPNAHIKMLTHTARMAATEARYANEHEGGGHPRKKEYVAQLTIYRAQWSMLTPVQRAAAIDSAPEAAKDLTNDQLDAALAVLEV